MRVIHLLRKCNPAEWGGTETALHRLLEGLRDHDVASVVYSPRLRHGQDRDASGESGWSVRRFNACLPIWGISRQQRRQLVAVSGNLLSFDLPFALRREPEVDVIHTHTLGRLGATALNVARWRRLPFVITIHGGVMDLPEAVKKDLHRPSAGWEWGKLFSLLLRTHRFFADADAILTCNAKEAELFREQHPGKRILVQPHGVYAPSYRQDHREKAAKAFPQIRDKQLLLCVGRIDPVKNQGWLIKQTPAILQRHPGALLVLAGACTDEAYGEILRQNVRRLGLENRVLVIGGLPPGDPKLIGLLQAAKVVILPSISETFGLIILEAWAAGAPVIASRTSGASALVKEGQNAWLFDLNDAGKFHTAIDAVLRRPDLAKELAGAGQRLVSAEYDTTVLAGRMKNLYVELIEEKHALRHSAR
ncbi:MAG: hypothetical protein DME26_18960, partial [Verrucomicrobia bacterium]